MKLKKILILIFFIKPSFLSSASIIEKKEPCQTVKIINSTDKNIFIKYADSSRYKILTLYPLKAYPILLNFNSALIYVDDYYLGIIISYEILIKGRRIDLRNKEIEICYNINKEVQINLLECNAPGGPKIIKETLYC